jgi:hypothetical protein
VNPVILGSSANHNAAGTTHVFNLPNGIQIGEMFWVAAAFVNPALTPLPVDNAPPAHWTRNIRSTNGVVARTCDYRTTFAVDGSEGFTGSGDTLTITTTAAVESACVALRISPNLSDGGYSELFYTGDSNDPFQQFWADSVARPTTAVAWIGGHSLGGTNGYPAGYTGIDDSIYGAPALVTVALAYHELGNSVGEDPPAFPQTGGVGINAHSFLLNNSGKVADPTYYYPYEAIHVNVKDLPYHVNTGLLNGI